MLVTSYFHLKVSPRLTRFPTKLDLHILCCCHHREWLSLAEINGQGFESGWLFYPQSTLPVYSEVTELSHHAPSLGLAVLFLSSLPVSHLANHTPHKKVWSKFLRLLSSSSISTQKPPKRAHPWGCPHHQLTLKTLLVSLITISLAGPPPSGYQGTSTDFCTMPQGKKKKTTKHCGKSLSDGKDPGTTRSMNNLGFQFWFVSCFHSVT